MIQEVPGIPLGRRLVMGDGPRTAKIVIVGEAPGSQEEKFGKPFIGAAGSLLTEALHKAGIPRNSCYITNVVKERPPSNDITKFIQLDRRIIETSDYVAYRDFLRSEILEIHPNIVVAAGAVPLWALCGLRGIQKYRGSILESTLIPGMKVVPILHPAAALRQYIWKHLISFDLSKVKREGEFPWFAFKKRELLLNPSYDDAISFLMECEQHDRVAFDIETYGTEVSCISFAYRDDLAISIPFVYTGGREFFSLRQEAEIWQRIARLLENPNIEALGQNTTFDATFLYRKYGIATSNIQDTMVATNLIFPDFSRSLAFLTSMYTDVPYYKDEGKDAIHGKAGLDSAFWGYNAKDSVVLMEIFPKQLEELRRQGNLDAYKYQVALISFLTYMTELGLRMDVEGLRSRASRSSERLIELQKELNDAAGHYINPNSPAQVRNYFYKELGLKPYKNEGKETTDEGALKRLARRGYKEAEILLEMRSVGKLEGTYFSMDLDSDGRLRSSMNPGRTSSGRLSSSKTIFGTGANMQNLPPAMKEFMLPDEGYIVYNVDLAQAENRIVAYIGPDLTMINAFETRSDLHALTASFIVPAFLGGVHMTPAEIKEQDALFSATGDPQYASPIGSGKFSWRFWGKKANHAFNYGQGYKAFSYQVEIMENEGKAIHERYHAAYPGVQKMHAWIQQQLRTNRTLENLFGRKRLYLDRWGDSLFLEAYSFIPQSTIADKINRQGILYMWNNPEFAGVQILNQVHDSIVFQIPIADGYQRHAEVLHKLIASLEQPLTFRDRTFVIPADVALAVTNFKKMEKLRLSTTVAETAKEIEKVIEGLWHGN